MEVLILPKSIHYGFLDAYSRMKDRIVNTLTLPTLVNRFMMSASTKAKHSQKDLR